MMDTHGCPGWLLSLFPALPLLPNNPGQWLRLSCACPAVPSVGQLRRRAPGPLLQHPACGPARTPVPVPDSQWDTRGCPGRSSPLLHAHPVTAPAPLLHPWAPPRPRAHAASLRVCPPTCPRRSGLRLRAPTPRLRLPRGWLIARRLRPRSCSLRRPACSRASVRRLRLPCVPTPHPSAGCVPVPAPAPCATTSCSPLQPVSAHPPRAAPRLPARRPNRPPRAHRLRARRLPTAAHDTLTSRLPEKRKGPAKRNREKKKRKREKKRKGRLPRWRRKRERERKKRPPAVPACPRRRWVALPAHINT